jgi:hypothetical protein
MGSFLLFKLVSILLAEQNLVIILVRLCRFSRDQVLLLNLGREVVSQSARDQLACSNAFVHACGRTDGKVDCTHLIQAL